MDGLAPAEEIWVSSPIQCLDKTVDEAPELIIICFGQISIKEREALVELCAALKRNRHTRHYPVVAMISGKQRILLESLNRAGVDFVRYIGEMTLDSMQLRKFIDNLGSDDRLERHLTALCPFLHYSEIDSRHELTMCGAYLDRMILGGRWLHDICETQSHLHCEYYLNPRIKS